MDQSENPKIEAIREKNNLSEHYYGDTVRKLFLAISFVMLVTTPFFQKFINGPVHLSVFVVVILVSLSGLMSPQLKLVKFFSFFVSLAGLFVFGQDAIKNYFIDPWLFEGVTIVLSVLFLFALYFSSKTIREVLLK